MARRRDVLLVLPVHASILVQETFRSEANLVLVRFSAMKGREFLTDLSADDIILMEDGQPQRIALFEGPLSPSREKGQIDFHILVDISGTVSPYAALTANLLRNTLLRNRPAETKVSIHAFAYRCEKLAGPTNEYIEIEKAVRALGTIDLGQRRPAASAIFDSILQAAAQIKPADRDLRPVLVVLSDGLDTSKRSPKDALHAARERALTVYPVMVVPKAEWSYGNAMKDFGDLGELTGGRGFWPPALTQDALVRIFSHIANQVSSEYTAGYYMAPVGGGPKTRKVEVRLRVPSRATVTGGVRSVTR